MKDKTIRFGFGRIVKLMLLTLAVFGATAVSAADFSSWANKMKITFTGYTPPGGTTTLTNFPVLVSFSNGLAGGFDYNDFKSLTNQDLRFTDSLTNELNYEIESWNVTTSSYVWVQVPKLVDNSTYIWAYWGKNNTNAPDYTSNGATWSNGFAGVWHLASQGGTLSASNSTSNSANGINSGATATNGVSDGAGAFGTSKYVNLGNNSIFSIGTGDFTVEAFINGHENTPANTDLVVSKFPAWNTTGWSLFVQNSAVTMYNYSASVTSGSGLMDGNWHHIVGRRNGTSLTVFADAIAGSSVTDAYNLNNSASCAIGYNPTFTLGSYFPGSIDEVRFSNVARSSNWIWTTFMNIASNQAFNQYSPVSQALSVTITNPVNNAYYKSLGVNVSIGAVAKDSATVNKVEFYANTTRLGNVTAAPYTFAWNNAPVGSYGLTAVAYDNLGSVATSSVINVTIVNWKTWAKQMTIRLAGYTPAETLTNFPVLVQFTEGSNRFHYADFGSPANAADLRFTDMAATNELNYEIDTWNTNGISSVWVQVPQLVDSNTAIQTFYGLSGQTVPVYTTNGTTWSGGFEAVWHLGETNGASSFTDSTLKHPATGNAPAQSPNGRIGNAQTFNGVNNYLSGGIIYMGNTICLSAWVNLDNTASSIQTVLASQGGGSGQDGFAFSMNSWNTADEMLRLDSGTGTTTSAELSATPANLVTYATWHYVAAVIDKVSATARIYVDGVDQTTTNGVQSGFNSYGKTVDIGMFASYQYYLKGMMDEIRIETSPRSSNWVWAAYMSVASNTTFNLYSNASGQPFPGTVVMFR
jgi:hypothetical protein